MASKLTSFKDHLEAAISLENRVFSKEDSLALQTQNGASPSGNTTLTKKTSTLPLWELSFQLDLPLKTKVFTSTKRYKVTSAPPKTKKIEPQAEQIAQPSVVEKPKQRPQEPSYRLTEFSSDASLVLMRWTSQKLISSPSNAFSWSEVRSAYKRLALQYHPDRWPNLKEAHDRFVACQKEYEVLKKDFARIKSQVKAA